MKHLKTFESHNSLNSEYQKMWDKFRNWLKHDMDFELYDGERDLEEKFLEISNDEKLSTEEKSDQICSYMEEHWGLYDGYQDVWEYLDGLYFDEHDTNENRTFENFNDDWIVDDVEYYDGYDDIIKITLTNGYELEAGEDTGGEFATLSIDGYKLQPGDKISFNVEPEEYDGMLDFMGIESININGKEYSASVGSEGGNSATFLTYKKQ